MKTPAMLPAAGKVIPLARRAGDGQGQSLVELALVLPMLILILAGVLDLARVYDAHVSITNASREGARYAIVHGSDCNLKPNNCAVTIRQISQQIRDYAVGFVPAEMRNVTFTSPTRTVTCSTLAACLSSGATGNTYWPAAAPGATADDGGNAMMGWVQVDAQYQFRSAISMFWPGAGRGRTFGTFVFPATSRETIQF